MKEEARLALAARRPNGADDLDPLIVTALADAAEDKQLGAWAEREQAADRTIAAKLASVPAPAALRERLLAGGRVSAPGWMAWFDKRVWRSFRNSELVAVAAIVLLLITAMVLRRTDDTAAVATWQEAGTIEVSLIEQSGSTDPLDLAVSEMPAIRSWLVEQTCPTPADLPAAVQKLRIHGCAKRMWRGQPMSIVCFAFPGDREVHLVTVDRKNLPASPPEGRPEFAMVRGYATAAWSEKDVAMMLVGKVELTELQALFPERSATAQRLTPQYFATALLY
jgi:hypothetical protein